MKTLFATLLFSFFSLAAATQELKNVKNTSNPNPFTEEREEYQVLKADKKIKQGNYQRFVNGKLVETGFYKDNQKDSTWTRFFPQTGAVQQKGNYIKNERAGIWQFYNLKNQMEQSYDFTARKLLSSNEGSSKAAWVISEKDTAQTVVDQAAVFIGGPAGYQEILAKNIRFPVSAMKKGVNGKVFVTFVIDEDGKASGHKVTKSLDKDCDAEALRVSQLLSEWLPAIKESKPVKSLHLIPVSFNFGGIVNR